MSRIFHSWSVNDANLVTIGLFKVIYSIAIGLLGFHLREFWNSFVYISAHSLNTVEVWLCRPLNDGRFTWEQSTYSAAYRLLLEGCFRKSKQRTLHICPTNYENLVFIGQTLRAVYLYSSVTSRLYLGFHSMDFVKIYKSHIQRMRYKPCTFRCDWTVIKGNILGR